MHIRAKYIDIVPARGSEQVQYRRIEGIAGADDEFANERKVGHRSVVGKHDEIPFEFVICFFKDGAEGVEVGVDVLDFAAYAKKGLHRHSEEG